MQACLVTVEDTVRIDHCYLTDLTVDCLSPRVKEIGVVSTMVRHARRFQIYQEQDILSGRISELLFRINALSNSLHHTLPSKAHRYLKESPITTPTQVCSNVHTQTMMNDHPNVSDHGTSLPTSHLLSLDRKRQRQDQRTKPNNSYWLSKTQATHTEVVMEVLVHEEPGSAEPQVESL
ncbi:hypothetical protein Q5P01_003996 [Channa striata]|uniref:Uncharacterized protein n=1 Tax=Channa striata TaxID=64152 RepID=A0AA88NKM1_CHASR|nr:hypothetical protein Q5P01_003996 [Channa striata]